MRRIKQQDGSGCGLACIAMLAGRPYKDVRDVAIQQLGLGKGGKFYTTTGLLKLLAAPFGFRIAVRRRKKFKCWSDLPDTAIVAINPKNNRRSWHWVVFVRRNQRAYVLDPKPSIKTSRRTDFGRMTPIGFIPID